MQFQISQNKVEWLFLTHEAVQSGIPGWQKVLLHEVIQGSSLLPSVASSFPRALSFLASSGQKEKGKASSPPLFKSLGQEIAHLLHLLSVGSNSVLCPHLITQEARRYSLVLCSGRGEGHGFGD